MSYLNYEFFDEFKALDNLCRDIMIALLENEFVEKKKTSPILMILISAGFGIPFYSI